MIISFAATTPALLNRAKTVTRREWQDDYAKKFHAGDIVDAWDKLPRTGMGRRVARIKITRDAYLEPLAAMPDSDYAAEGFEWMQSHREFELPRIVWGKVIDGSGLTRETFNEWRASGLSLWVVRFELVELITPAIVEGGGD